jgi:ribosomal protein S27E
MVKAGKQRQVKGLFQRHKCQNCGSIQLGEKLD